MSIYKLIKTKMKNVLNTSSAKLRKYYMIVFLVSLFVFSLACMAQGLLHNELDMALSAQEELHSQANGLRMKRESLAEMQKGIQQDLNIVTGKINTVDTQLQGLKDQWKTQQDIINTINGGTLDDLVTGIIKCENSDTNKNGAGIMCWDKAGNRSLCILSPQETRDEVKAILNRYEAATPGLTVYKAIERYAPPFENDTRKHAQCISDNSNVALDRMLSTLL